MSEEKPVEEEKPQKVKIRDVTEEGAAKSKELRYTKRLAMTYTNDEGVTLQGEFTIKRPTLGEQARIGVICAEMRQDKPLSALDRATASLHDALASCSVCIIKAPPWWDPENMYDTEPLMQLFKEAIAFWNSFRKDSVG